MDSLTAGGNGSSINGGPVRLRMVLTLSAHALLWTLVFVAASGCVFVSHEYRLNEDEPIRPFAAESIDGERIESRDFRGHVTVLSWFYIGCPSYNETMTDFQHVARAAEVLLPEGVQFVTIASLCEEDEAPRGIPLEDELRTLRAMGNMTWPMVADHDLEIANQVGFPDCGDYCVAIIDSAGIVQDAYNYASEDGIITFSRDYYEVPP